MALTSYGDASPLGAATIRLGLRSALKEDHMRARLAALSAAAILITGTSAINADILCAAKVGYLRGTLRDRLGPNCPAGERQVNPAAMGLLGLPGQYTAKGIPIFDCSICVDGKLTFLSTCESPESTLAFGHPPGATEGGTITTKQCKLAGFLIAPSEADQKREQERRDRRDLQ